MGEVFLKFFWRGISLSPLLMAVFVLTPYCRKKYRASVIRSVWILFGILLLVPWNISGFSFLEIQPNLLVREQKQEEEPENKDETAQTKAYVADTVQTTVETVSTEKSEKILLETKEEMRQEIRDSLWIPKSNRQKVLETVGYVWLSGAVLFGLWMIGNYLWWKKRVFSWNRQAGKRLQSMVLEAARQTGVRPPKVYINDRVGTPLLSGAFRFVLLIPPDMAMEEEGIVKEERDACREEGEQAQTAWHLALCHECMHKKKKDLWVQMMWAVLNCIYWYHPLVYLSQKNVRDALEFACDESVLEGKDEKEKISYGEALLFFAKSRRDVSKYLILSFARGGSQLEGRIYSIFGKGQRKKGKQLLILFLVIGMVSSNLIGCEGKSSTADFRKTEELVICFDNTRYGDMMRASETYVNNVLNYYKVKYPDVEVKLEGVALGGDSAESEAARKRLKTEIMAGDGPDLLICSGDDLMDNPVKQMESGLFCDLNPYLEKSEEISEQELNQAILESGQVEGAQYLMPLDYNIYHALSKNGVLEKYGFSVEEAQTSEGFLDQAEKFYEASKNEVPLMLGWGIQRENTMFGCSLCVLFPELLDDADGILPFEDNDVKRWFSLYRAEREALLKNWTGMEEDPECGKNYLLEDSISWELIFGYDSTLEDGKPVYLMFQSEGNGTTAVVSSWAGVLENAKNKQNAWNFIEMMLSYDSQRLCVKDRSLPVRTDMQEELKSTMQQYSGNLLVTMSEEEADQLIEDMIDAMTNVNDAVISDSVYEKILEYFEPYVTGEASYEECAEKAQQYYEIYLSE